MSFLERRENSITAHPFLQTLTLLLSLVYVIVKLATLRVVWCNAVPVAREQWANSVIRKRMGGQKSLGIVIVRLIIAAGPNVVMVSDVVSA